MFRLLLHKKISIMENPFYRSRNAQRLIAFPTDSWKCGSAERIEVKYYSTY